MILRIKQHENTTIEVLPLEERTSNIAVFLK
jgi:hypothetical protein